MCKFYYYFFNIYIYIAILHFLFKRKEREQSFNFLFERKMGLRGWGYDLDRSDQKGREKEKGGLQLTKIMLRRISWFQ